MKNTVRKEIEKAFIELDNQEGWGSANPGAFDVSHPREEKFGDFSTNLAMIMASRLKKKPRDLAELLTAILRKNDLFESVEVAGPGFINFRLRPVRWARELGRVFREKESFGRVEIGKGEKVMVEFVSANPTGPLHIGHGRGAAVGDALASILRWAGYDVVREYYTNDVGLQMDNLGRSTLLRARELAGEILAEEPAYKGEYMKDVARAFMEKHGPDILSAPEAEALAIARDFAAENIMEGIRKDLADFNVHFDIWYSEKTLHESGSVEKLIDMMLEQERIYEKDGALWLKTDEQGDEKDRVVRRANGVTTYLAADIAYHKTKLDRNFSTLVNIWGADHHGYVPRMKAVISALGGDPDKLVVRLVQLVSLKKGGQTYAMSTREGVFTTLREIMDEVGADAVRYFFLMRSSDSQMEFDVELAKSQSSENPVFYVQYAHARCSSIFRQAEEKGVATPDFQHVNPELLTGEGELRLIRKLMELPEIVEVAASSFQPHHLTQYMYEVAGLFHHFYKHNRVVGEDEALSAARLSLVMATQMILKNGLGILGINAPDKM